MVLGIDVHDVWPILLAAAPLVGASFAGVNAYLNARNERRRSQPVVIAHEHRSALPDKDRPAEWVAEAWISNAGGGAAYNVRFGIEMNGYRLPFRADGTDGPAARQRVVASNERLPETVPSGAFTVFPIRIATTDIYALGKGADDARRWWCRYENAYGQTWETMNPHEAWGDMDIRRVRRPKRAEKREEKRRKQLRQTWERRLEG
jgi:hypothetical protein